MAEHSMAEPWPTELKLDKDNDEAQNVLGLIYSAWAEGSMQLPPGLTQAQAREAAIEHLSAIQASPMMATNPNLQLMLGRLHLRHGKPELALPILEKVAQQVPWAAEPFIYLFEAQRALGRDDEAGESLRNAVVSTLASLAARCGNCRLNSGSAKRSAVASVKCSASC